MGGSFRFLFPSSSQKADVQLTERSRLQANPPRCRLTSPPALANARIAGRLQSGRQKQHGADGDPPSQEGTGVRAKQHNLHQSRGAKRCSRSNKKPQKETLPLRLRKRRRFAPSPPLRCRRHERTPAQGQTPTNFLSNPLEMGVMMEDRS